MDIFSGMLRWSTTVAHTSLSVGLSTSHWMKPQQRSSTRLLSKVVAARPESHAMNKVMKHLPDEPDIRKKDDLSFGVGFLSP